MSFSVTGVLVCVVLFYFAYVVIGAGARGCVVDSLLAAAQGWFHPAGVGLLANLRVILGT